jgi:hypothetical protein
MIRYRATDVICSLEPTQSYGCLIADLPDVKQHADACATSVVELQDVVALIAIAYGTHVLLHVRVGNCRASDSQASFSMDRWRQADIPLPQFFSDKQRSVQ